MEGNLKTVLFLCCRPFQVRAVRIMTLKPSQMPTATQTHDIIRDVTFSCAHDAGLPVWSNLREFEQQIHLFPYDHFYLYAHDQLYMTVVDMHGPVYEYCNTVWFSLEEVSKYNEYQLRELSGLRRLGVAPDNLDCFRYPEKYFSNPGKR